MESNLQTDWKICCLCQKKTNEKLRDVGKRNDLKIKCFKQLATNIVAFQKLCALPLPINVERLDNGRGIEQSLIDNAAVYHRSCYLLFNNTKLNRAELQFESRKRKQSESDEATRCKRKRVDMKDPICFICELKQDSDSNLHNVETLYFCEQITELATELNDTSLLKKVSCEDPIALELKYHNKCYLAIKNRVRSIRRHQKREMDDASENSHAYPRALSELVTYIYEQNVANTTDKPVVFKLTDLTYLYTERLKQLGIETPIVHKSRLKEMLQTHLPELGDFISGRDIVLTLKQDVGPILTKSSEYNDAVVIEKAASLLRHKMLQCKSSFHGNFEKDYVKNCVPDQLMQFIESCLNGAKIGDVEIEPSKEDIALAHLLQFNCHLSYKKNSVYHRHSSQREPAFPVFLGLSVYSKYRKEALVDLLFQQGLSISYDRVLDISNAIGQSVVDRFIQNETVCPLNLKKGIFTTAAVDNIDHNPTAATAKTSFHGTSISLFQNCPSEGISQENLTISNEKVKRISPLPEHYTNVKPAGFNKQPKPVGQSIPDLV